MLSTTALNALLHFGSVVLLAVGALLPIVDPLGGAPIYLAMTASLTHEERSRMAKAVAVNSFLLLVASALIGAYVLDFFGLSIPAVQVAGGIVVCLDRLVAAEQSQLAAGTATQLDPDDSVAEANRDVSDQRAFYPMTMPLTVGPGSISVALTLGANPAPGFRSLLATSLAQAIGILIVAIRSLPVLSLRRPHPAQARRHRYQCGRAPVGIHPAVHRGADLLERHPRTHRRRLSPRARTLAAVAQRRGHGVDRKLQALTDTRILLARPMSLE